MNSYIPNSNLGASLVAQMVKSLPAMWENLTPQYSSLPSPILYLYLFPTEMSLTPTIVHLVSFSILLYIQKDSRIFTLTTLTRNSVFKVQGLKGFLLSFGWGGGFVVFKLKIYNHITIF